MIMIGNSSPSFFNQTSADILMLVVDNILDRLSKILLKRITGNFSQSDVEFNSPNIPQTIIQYKIAGGQS